MKDIFYTLVYVGAIGGGNGTGGGGLGSPSRIKQEY